MIITIDGPSGTGKSTAAKDLAKSLGYRFVNTGAMYRAFTYYWLKSQISLENEEAIAKLCNQFSLKISFEEERYFCDNEEITEQIRSPEVTDWVSPVSALSLVRRMLTQLQRQIGQEGNAVFEGRDMGSVVFPNAQKKFFLTATPEVRAKRRFLEVQHKEKVDEKTVLKSIEKRDHFDLNRALAPLKEPKGAIVIDTSDLTFDEVVARLIQEVNSDGL